MRSQFTQTHFQLSVCPPDSPRLLIHLLRSSAVLTVLLASNYLASSAAAAAIAGPPLPPSFVDLVNPIRKLQV